MTGSGTGAPAWTMVDEGWGRKAVDFATLSEPGNCREYVAVHHLLGIDDGDRLLDVACGSGLAIELARLRGAECAGIDASPRLVAVARFRCASSDMGGRHARSSLGRRCVRSRDQLPRYLGHDAGCGRRDRSRVAAGREARV